MRDLLAASLFALASAPLMAQAATPAASSPGTHTYSSPLGFSYAIPSNWDVIDSQRALPEAKEKETLSGTGQTEKKGMACTQLSFTARHGDPRSVIDQVVLPLDCPSQPLTGDDLPVLGTGATKGIKQNFDIGEPLVATYTLGTHRLWAERVQGTLKGQTDMHYTIEISCTLLSKAAVCWLTMAADGASLADFENATVTLDGDSPAPLVPAAIFKQ
jgi:hypothetical protein